jgi:hypothetical protein
MNTFPLPSLGFALRLSLSGLLAGAAHQFQWVDLRFLVSQAIVDFSRLLGMRAERVAFDTVEVQGHMIQFVVACTFVELMLGIQPFLWHRNRRLWHNFMRIAVSIGALFGFNILRIEAAQILFDLGVPWVVAHDIPLGAIYFGIWAAVWRTREWRALQVYLVNWPKIARQSMSQAIREMDDADELLLVPPRNFQACAK